MKAMVLEQPAAVDSPPLRCAMRRCRSPARANCGCWSDALPSAAPICTWWRAICRQQKLPVIPGHQVVGIVDKLGPGCRGTWTVGMRSGIAWLQSTCGCCEFCNSRTREPLRRNTLHRLPRRRRLRRICPGPRGVRLPDPDGLERRRGRPLLVCRHHRLSGPGAGQLAARRNPGHVRLRLIGARAHATRAASR